jgi:hypothetical protein
MTDPARLRRSAGGVENQEPEAGARTSNPEIAWPPAASGHSGVVLNGS